MELVILELLEYQLYFPEIMSFLKRYLRSAMRNHEEIFVKTCQYLIDASLVDKAFSTILPSKQASASILASNVLFYVHANTDEPTEDKMWSPTLKYYTKYSLEDVIYTARSMIKGLKTPEYSGAAQKYKSYSKHRRVAYSGHLQLEYLIKAEDWLTKIIQS